MMNPFSHFRRIPAMKRPAAWIAAGLVVNAILAATANARFHWFFLSGSSVTMPVREVFVWTIIIVAILANLAQIAGLTCLLRKVFRIWWIGAFAWAATIGLWPLAALLPVLLRLGDRPAARLAAWGGAAFLLAGVCYGLMEGADVPAAYWGVLVFGYLGTGLVLAALRRHEGNTSSHRAFAWVFAATVAIAIATQPAWHVRRMERQADEAFDSLLETLGFSREQVEAMFVLHPPVATEDDVLAALNAGALDAEGDSLSELRKMVYASKGGKGSVRLHPLLLEEIDAIKTWFATHTNRATAADAVSSSPDYRSCLPGPETFENAVAANVLQPDPRLTISDSMSYASLIQIRADAALTIGEGTAGAEAAIRFHNMAARFEQMPTLLNFLVASEIDGLESVLLHIRIDLWSEEALLAMQRRADNAVEAAEQRARAALACEACYMKYIGKQAVTELMQSGTALLRGSRAFDFWMAEEFRAQFRFMAESWEAERPLFATAEDEPLGETIVRLEEEEEKRSRVLPPVAKMTVRAQSSTIDEFTVTVRNRAAFVRAAVAIERYRRTHGSLPPSLDELVPDFLPSVPVDAHDGKPLAYEPGPIAIPEEVFPVLDDPDALAVKARAHQGFEPEPETRTLPAQTLPGFLLAMPNYRHSRPDYRKRERDDTDYFFFIPD